MLPPGVEVAPKEVIQSTRCNCASKYFLHFIFVIITAPFTSSLYFCCVYQLFCSSILGSQCKTLACSCNKAHVLCSKFCGCSESSCLNKWNLNVDGDEESENDDATDEE